MRSVLQSHFADYAAFHESPGNRACHMVGIPLIVLTLLGLLTRVPLAEVGGVTLTLAELLLVAVSIYYLTLNTPLGLLAFVALAAFAAAGRFLPLGPAVALFVLGWVLQFVGHSIYEKRPPAFSRNLIHLLIGPLWIVAKATGRA